MRFGYQARGREGKSRLLDELIEICGVSRKHAIKVMNQSVGSTVNRTETRGRKTIYGANELKVLKVIWLAANQPCGKLLQPMIGMWLPHYEKEHGRLGNGLTARTTMLAWSKRIGLMPGSCWVMIAWGILSVSMPSTRRIGIGAR